MKKFILIAVMVAFIVLPVIFWARSLMSGVSWDVHLYAAGRILGLVGFIFIFFQYVLSSRMKLIERGIGLDRIFRIHKTCGLIGLSLVFIHPITFFISDKIQGYDSPLSTSKIIGVVTLFIIILVAAFAMLYRKLRLKYETWKNIHRIGYVVLPMGFIHSLSLGSDLYSQPLRTFWWVLVSLYGVVIVYKLGNWIYIRRHPFKIAKVSQETHDTWSLYFEGRNLNYKPGQFLVINLVRDGKVSEAHPFTISSSPTQDKLSITVKSVGDFTSTIGDTKTSDAAYIDAPYGVFSFLNHDTQALIFIAGGIGITPFMSMLRYIYDRNMERNVVLMWGNKTEEDITFREELEKMAEDMPSLEVVHVMSKQEDWQGEKGYIDSEKLKKYVSNLERSQFFVCGPPRMMASVIKALKDLGVSEKRIHYERFAL